MPNNRKSRVIRLPKSERHHASSKIIIHTPRPPSPIPQRPPKSLNQQGIPPLDDQSLSKLLFYAGPRTILSALNVCTQWRRVALELLSRVTFIDVGKIYLINNHRSSFPTETQVLNMLSNFPNINHLSFQCWRFDDIMEDIASIVTSNFASPTLKEVNFSNVLLKGRDLVSLFENCPQVRSLRLGQHVTHDDTVLRQLATYCENRRVHQPDFQIHSIIIAAARAVTATGIIALLRSAPPKTLQVTKCRGLKHLSWSSTLQTPIQKLSLAACPSLSAVSINVAPQNVDVLDLNLSQSSHLYSLSFRGHDLGVNYALALTRLNLSGCRQLRNLTVPPSQTPWEAFRNLEELNMYGTHGLDPQVFHEILGLSQHRCALPSLHRLTVTGCRLDVLRLIGYPQLVFVDCSGCSELATLEIRDCWELETLVLKGKKSPLNSVQLALPAKCEVQGLRKQWHWEGYHTNQIVMFP